MEKSYTTKLVKKVVNATDNQIKYWVKIKLVVPDLRGKNYFFSFRDIIKLKLIVDLKKNGLSLQKIRKGMRNLSESLPYSDQSLSQLLIYTDGSDMIVVEKGVYFSAITRQSYIKFDTEAIRSEIIETQNITENGTMEKSKISAQL